jgi:hypothetical protein
MPDLPRASWSRSTAIPDSQDHPDDQPPSAGPVIMSVHMRAAQFVCGPRVEGMIARNFDSCFAIDMELSPSRREHLAETFAWLVNRHRHGTPDNRLHQRTRPFRKRATLTTPDGRQYPAALIDLSMLGAALHVDAAPPIGSPVTIGKTSARVVRHFATGIVLEFDEALPADTFGVDTKL